MNVVKEIRKPAFTIFNLSALYPLFLLFLLSCISIEGAKSTPPYTPEAQIHQPVQSYDSCLRIRIEYSSTSDWTTLDILDSTNVLSTRIISISGNPTGHKVANEALSINQSLDSTNSGNKISMTVDCLLAPETQNSSINFRLKKGDLNESKVLISSVNNDNIDFIKEIILPSGSNFKEFSVNFSETKYRLQRIQKQSPSDGIAEVTLDLAIDRGPVTYRASGFLHNPDPVLPSVNVLDVLKPTYFRSHPWRTFDQATYDRVEKLGATHGIVVSDGWGYGGKWPGDPDPNVNSNWKEWEGFVRKMAEKAKNKGFVLSWDIWNEPDANYFWNPNYPKIAGATWSSSDQFLETFRRAVLQIRSVFPNAEIVGPSLATFSNNTIRLFLEFCNKNDILPNVVSWHEFENGSLIPSHVSLIRDYLNSIAQTNIKFHINEYLGDRDKTNGACAVEYMAGLEQAKVDAAAKACWGEIGKAADAGCSPEFFNNMLTAKGELRSVWWAYKGYANITHRLIGVIQGTEVFAVAGVDPNSYHLKAVLGRISGSGNIKINVINLSSAPYLLYGQKTHIKARKVKGSRSDAASPPSVEVDSDIVVDGDQITITLPHFAAEDVYLLSLTSGSR